MFGLSRICARVSDTCTSRFDQSIRVNPTVDAYYQRGQIHYGLGQLQQAIDDYDRAIALAPDAPYIYRARASARAGKGDAAGAAEDRETALNLVRER